MGWGGRQPFQGTSPFSQAAYKKTGKKKQERKNPPFFKNRNVTTSRCHLEGRLPAAREAGKLCPHWQWSLSAIVGD
jgi:hypothetical protein